MYICIFETGAKLVGYIWYSIQGGTLYLEYYLASRPPSYCLRTTRLVSGYLDPGPCHLVPGPCHLDHATWYLDHATWYLDHATGPGYRAIELYLGCFEVNMALFRLFWVNMALYGPT